MATQIEATTDQGPLGVLANKIADPPVSLQIGKLVASDFGLADRVLERRAVGIVVASESGSILLITSSGEIVKWPEHGLGAAGTRLWLGESGGYLSAPPVAGLVQEVAVVLDGDNILFVPPAISESSSEGQTHYAFGGNMETLGNFARANGTADAADTAQDFTTGQPVTQAGNISSLAYRISSGNIETQYKVWVDGGLVAMILLDMVIFVNVKVVSFAPVAVSPGSYIELEYDAGQSTGKSIFTIIQT